MIFCLDNRVHFKHPSEALSHFRECATLWERIDSGNNQSLRADLQDLQQIIAQLEERDVPSSPSHPSGASLILSPELLAVLEQISSAPSEAEEIVERLQHEDPALLMELLEFIEGSQSGSGTK